MLGDFILMTAAGIMERKAVQSAGKICVFFFNVHYRVICGCVDWAYLIKEYEGGAGQVESFGGQGRAAVAVTHSYTWDIRCLSYSHFHLLLWGLDICCVESNSHTLLLFRGQRFS